MRARQRVSFWVTLVLIGIVAASIVAAFGLRVEARGFPIGVASATLVMLLIALVGEFNPKVEALLEISWEGADFEEGLEAGAGGQTKGQERVSIHSIPWSLVGLVFGSIAGYAVGVLLIGFILATPLYVFLFSRLYGGATWRGSIGLAACTTAGMLGLSQFLRADLYPGLVNGAQVPPF